MTCAEAFEHPQLAAMREQDLHRFLGMSELRAADGRADFEVSVGDAAINVYGRTHAAFCYTFLDVACYAALLSVLPHDRSATTADIHVSMMSGTQLGDRVRFEARILKRGRNLAFLVADAWCGDKPIAQGRLTKFILA
ncbi:PaaI family thioesterase [Solimonas marina]|uniref:PaaI family thioesterase n=1 Tax=Solimonas marina TaxID=2714601 RepID=A0A970BA30_9GAMM|nr:PaaI family thioesterase [Solimonas marina]NKF23964.1 PaaI family thioesterase [Solimonas marina]